ncbi:MAG: hypothetical protein U0325_24660 [Polyangiales bacterium]
MRVIEVSRRPVYDAALAIAVVVLAGNGLWAGSSRWIVGRRLLLATLTAVVVNALIDVFVDQRLHVRLTAQDGAAGTPRVIPAPARVVAMGTTLLVLFGVSRALPGDASFSRVLALAAVAMTLALGAAERGMTRRLSGEARDLGPTATGDAVLAVVLLGLCAVDIAVGSPGSSPLRVFALLILSGVVLVARSVDATMRQRRALVAGFERATTRLHESMRVQGRNWGAVDDGARDGAWATQAILSALDLREGLKVADVGAGAGYFTRKLCVAVGPTGRVYATDRDLWAASKLRELGEREGLLQLTTMHVDGSVPLPVSERVDRVLLVNVGLFALTRAQEGRAFFVDTAAKLYPGGRLVIFQEFVHQAGFRSEPGFPVLADDEPEADTVIAWAEPRFDVVARPALPDPARPLRPHEQKGYLLVLQRR